MAGIRRIGSIAAIGAVASVLAACGGGGGSAKAGSTPAAGSSASAGSAASSKPSASPLDGSPSAVIAASVDRTLAAKNAKTKITGQITSAGRTIPLNGGGVIDFATGNADITLTIPQTGQIDERFVNKIVYLKLPASATSELGGKPWLKLDPSALTSNGSNPFSSLSNNNPASALAQLKTVGDVTKVGTEPIDGVSTEHLHATVDLLKAADQANFSDAVKQQLIKTYGSSGKQAEDIWIDGQGQIRRIASALKINTGSATGSTKFQADYYDYGQADTSGVVAPPAEQTTDFTAYLKNFGSSTTTS